VEKHTQSLLQFLLVSGISGVAHYDFTMAAKIDEL